MGWFDIDILFPPDSVLVFVCSLLDNCQYIQVAFYSENEDVWYVNLYGKLTSLRNVTHWSPICKAHYPNKSNIAELS